MCWQGNGWYLRQRCCQQREMQAPQLLLAQGLICSCTSYLQCLQGQGWLLPRPWPFLPAGSAFACPLCLLGQGGTVRAESGCAWVAVSAGSCCCHDGAEGANPPQTAAAASFL